MTSITVSDSEAPTDHALLRLSSSTNVLPGLVLRDLSLAGVLKSLIQNSKTSYSSYNASFRETCITDVVKDLVLCGLVQGSVQLSYRRYVRVRKLMWRFRKALRLVRNVNGQKASSSSASASGALSATHFANAMLCGAKERDELLNIKTLAAHTRGRKQNSFFNGRATCFYAVPFLQEPKTLHSSAYAEHSSSFV